MLYRLVLALLVVAGLGTTNGWAQSSASGRADSLRGRTPSDQSASLASWWAARPRFSVWFGGSNHASEILGRTRNATFRIVGLRYTHRLTDGPSPTEAPRRFVLFYTADVIPYAHLSVPGSAIPIQFDVHGDPLPRPDLGTTGVGAAPVGFQLNARLHPRLQPFVNASTGVLYFLDPVPDRRGESFNFTIDLGLGVQVAVTDALRLSIGYRYHHLSNGYRGRINPGVDANLFYVGAAVGW